MRYPQFLKDNGTIGFVAPSFGCSIEPYRSAFDHSLKGWKKKGYKTVLGPNVYEQSGTGISAAPEKCGAELTEAYISEKSDVLISCGGGELMCEILDHVDFDRIREAPPKWYMGYSDNTNFTFLLTTLCDTASIYGPCAASFGMEPWHASIGDAYDLLRGKNLTMTGYDLYEKESLKDETNPLEPYHVTEPRRIYAFTGTQPARKLSRRKEVRFSGRLIGGCMDCLVNLTGTCYDGVAAFQERYASDGFIWFLEACDLNVFAIRRAIWEMQHAGWFRYVKGFLFGRPLNGEEAFGLDHFRAVTELLAPYHVPILMDLDIGHLPPMMPIITGAVADVTCKGQEFELNMRLEP